MGNTPYYEQWMKSEGIPIHRGYSVGDVRNVERSDWSRIGGKGAFIQLIGMEGFTGIQVGEIAPGKALLPQQHLHQSYVTILEGEGRTDFWPHGEDSQAWSLNWQTDSLFGVPLNCRYQLHNTGTAPALYMSVNDAPLMLDLFYDAEAVFGSKQRFPQRLPKSKDDLRSLARREDPDGVYLEGFFIESVRDIAADAHDGKGEGVNLTTFELAGNTLASHVADWPAGSYHKAHHHMGGAVLYIVKSRGYTLMWPQEMGWQPYASGNGDQVVRIDWGEGTVFSPPSKWFHQHFNVDTAGARQLAFRGSAVHPLGIRRAGNRLINGVSAGYTSVRDGGNVIDWDVEDPQIRQDYMAAVAAGPPAGVPAGVDGPPSAP